MKDFENQVVVVTGAGQGIGRAHAERFCALGARVVVNDVGVGLGGDAVNAGLAAEVAAALRERGGEAIACRDSVATMAGAQAIVDCALSAYGRVDVWVNNAGILRDRTLLKMDEATWDAVIDVHLKGTFACTQVAAKQMRAQGEGGSIVNTTSVSGLYGNFGQCNYGAAKAGIYALTRIAALEFERWGIRVNAVAPIALTRMTSGLARYAESDADALSPAHISEVVAFLASERSAPMSGETLGVKGTRVTRFEMVEHGPLKPEEDRWDLDRLVEASQNAGWLQPNDAQRDNERTRPNEPDPETPK